MADVTVKKTEKLKRSSLCAAIQSLTRKEWSLPLPFPMAHLKFQIPYCLKTQKPPSRHYCFGRKSEGCRRLLDNPRRQCRLRAAKEPIDCGESGATLRFMIPVAALATGSSTLVFRGSIEKRPIEPLLDKPQRTRRQSTCWKTRRQRRSFCGRRRHCRRRNLHSGRCEFTVYFWVNVCLPNG